MASVKKPRIQSRNRLSNAYRAWTKTGHMLTNGPPARSLRLENLGPFHQTRKASILHMRLENMISKLTVRALTVCLAAVGLGCSTAHASLDGAGSIMIIPVVAQTVSYTSEITVRNPYNNLVLPISVFYTGAITTSAAGRRTCTPLNVPPLGTVQFSIAAQCGLPSGSQFGYVTLAESYSYPSPFQAFSRTQTPGGNGFSVPAYPAGAIEAPAFGHHVVGLKRQAAAPIYQSNCFVASTDDATPYQIRLFDSAGNQIGSTINGSLTAYQMVRYLDIFSAAGLPPGDRSNVSAQFSSGAGTAALISFCTVQESTFFGADFRMAQPLQTLDGTRQRPLDSSGLNFTVVSYTAMMRHDVTFRHPDFIRCVIDSPSAPVLQLRIKSPSGAVVAGGTNTTDSGEFYTGNRSLYSGFSDIWELDVASKPSYAGSFPIPYSFTCYSGNGGQTTSITRILTADF